MTFYSDDFDLPPAYGGCACSCHRNPGVMHVMACCGLLPSSQEPLDVFEVEECACALCAGRGSYGIPGQRCQLCDGTGKTKRPKRSFLEERDAFDALNKKLDEKKEQGS